MSDIKRPLVAIPSDLKTIDNVSWHAISEQYLIAAAEVAGLTPIMIPALGAAISIETILEAVDGVLLSGSASNIYPDHYGAEASQAYEPFDRARDATTLPLIRKAIEKGLPLLAICRGLQELNVALGGSLSNEVQEIEGRKDHRAPTTEIRDELYGLAHPVTIEANSCLATIINAETITVNSLHRQAIDTLAPSLTVEAMAEDGTIEAVSVKNAKSFAIGTQWHPEYWAKTDAPSRQIFEAFGDAVRAHHQKRS
ncbi:gamma-glutamyl-gamma-aminobutyrate hydrolase family protein [Paenochrobactrum sp. BZR 588]|uniref:gamma-glutamyl-gamma-aminobutyrate hydrolase family protein n=1 Tax=unclassified Paenochrobactrum TaxID=2639760 RepID=UPI0038555CE5